MTTTYEKTPDHPHDNPDMHVSFNEWLDYMAEEFPDIDAMRFYETREIVDKVKPEAEPEATNYMGDDWEPDYSKTAEWEGEGIESELIPGEAIVADTITYLAEKAGLPPEAGLALAGIVKKNPKQVKKGVQGMLKGSKGSKVQVKPKDKFDNSKGSRHAVQRDTLGKPKVTKADKPKGMTTQRKAELTTAGGLTTALGLSGLRGKDGSLQPAEPTPEVVTPDVEPEAPSNQFGYHKREGQNFWTVDNDDPYWDTHDIEGSTAFEEAPLKEQPQQELDWDFWFK